MLFMLRRIDYYIIKKFLGTYVLSIVLIISIAIVIDITEKMDDFYNEGLDMKTIIFDYYIYFIPYYTNLFSSLFTFLAVIFVTSKTNSTCQHGYYLRIKRQLGSYKYYCNESK